MKFRIIVFLILNFAALAIGSMYTSTEVNSNWYLTLNKAPWSPPGWVFGFAWTIIMSCFSVYMGYLWQAAANKAQVLGSYILQWILNVAWSPVFFCKHQIFMALIIISLLSLLIGYMLINYKTTLQKKSFLLLPYFLWLLLATSLNAYIFFMN